MHLVSEAAVFFCNQPVATKLPLRTLHPLVSIQTRLIRDVLYIRPSGMTRGLPPEYSISMNHGENG
ncbi:hypothetical protein DF211_12525 [Pectobacterium parmentieri]|nr:hypothetical protein DF211_12525 [Pectobacterium parmentieri]